MFKLTIQTTMPPRTATKATYSRRGKAVTSYKETAESGSGSDQEEDGTGKLLEEMDDIPSTAKGRAKPKPKPPANPKPKPTQNNTITKSNPPSLPSTSKVVKPSLSKVIKPTPKASIKAKPESADSESDFDSDQEEEKAELRSKSRSESKITSASKTPKPLSKDKRDSSKIPNSKISGDSARSFNQDKSIAKRTPIAPVPPPDTDEEDYGPDIDMELADAVDKNLEEQGLSSSPGLNTLAKPKKEDTVGLVKSATEDVAEDREEGETGEEKEGVEEAGHQASLGEPEQSQAQGQAESESESEAKSESLSSNPDQIESQSPKPKGREYVQRNHKAQALKRMAEYDPSTVAHSERGTAGLLLEEMDHSPSKKPRLSASSKSNQTQSNNENVGEGPFKSLAKAAARKPTPKGILKTPKGKTAVAKKSPATPLPPIDYASIAHDAGYGKDVLNNLILISLARVKDWDWYEMSITMADKGVTRLGGGKGRKAKEIINGNELHDLWHNVSLS
jgi:hypothetical protein